MEMRFPGCEDVASQEHLSDDEVVGGKGTCILLDELALTHGRGSLQAGKVGRPIGHTQGGKARSHGSRAHQNGRMA